MLYIVSEKFEEFYPVEVSTIESAGDLSKFLAENNHIKTDLFVKCHPRVLDFLKILKPDVKIVIDIPRVEIDPSSNLVDIDKVEFKNIEKLLINSNSNSYSKEESRDDDFSKADENESE